LTSPAHFRLARQNLLGHSTQAKDFGSLVHLLLLQPHLTAHAIAVYPGVADGRDADYKAFAAQNANKLVVDEPTLQRAMGLVERLKARRYKGRALSAFLDESLKEVSLYVREPVTGLRLRARPDIYHPDFIFDLKTTRQSTLDGFCKDAVGFHYDMQAYMYLYVRAVFEGSTVPKPFVFVAVESEEPHSIFTASAGGSFLENGSAKFQRCLALYRSCSDQDYWPDCSEDGELEIEPWQQFNK